MSQPTNPADLDQLDAAYAASTQGEWKFTVSKSGRNQVSAKGLQVCQVWGTIKNPAADTGSAIALLHNSYPALSQELRQLRSRVLELELREMKAALQAEAARLREEGK